MNLFDDVTSDDDENIIRLTHISIASLLHTKSSIRLTSLKVFKANQKHILAVKEDDRCGFVAIQNQ